MKLLYTICISLLLLVGCSSSEASTYRGKVIDRSTGEPIINARVSLQLAADPSDSVLTDAEGQYVFQLNLGKNTNGRITVESESYERYQANIVVEPNQQQLKEIQLLPGEHTSVIESTSIPPMSPSENPSDSNEAQTPTIKQTKDDKLEPQWQLKLFNNNKLDFGIVGETTMPLTATVEGGTFFYDVYEQRQAGDPVPHGQIGLQASGVVPFKKGTYFFHCHKSGGCRVNVGTQSVFENWYANNDGYDIKIELEEGTQPLIIQYFDVSGFGWIDVTWEYVEE